LTTARYYTPNGHAIQADGVHPDVAVESVHPPENVLSFREKDLEGHLHAEAPDKVAPPKSVVTVSSDAGPLAPEATGREARNVPDDPSESNDPALKVAWQMIRQPAP
jgi:carboxyl-terminal processing protease